MILIEFPLRTYSLTNQRAHWTKKAQIARDQRTTVAWRWIEAKRPKVNLPTVITLTRIAGRVLDTDNLASSFKHVRDEIALQIGIDDGDPQITWLYAQEKGKEYKIRIEIGAKETA